MFTLMEVLKSLAPWFTAAIVVVLSPMVKDHIPVVVSNYLFSIYEDYFYSRLTFTNIEEYGDITRDQIYEAATIYLRKKINDSAEAKRFICRKTLKQNKPICDIAREDAVIDNFRGIRLEWKLREEKTGYQNQLQPPPDKNFFQLTFDKRFKKDVVESYLPYVIDRAEKIQREEQGIRLYSPNCYPGMPLRTGQEWSCAILQHPATFDKLAMSPERKRNLKEDLDRFVQRKEWYKKVGRAWKRGYLIYGPPGTGKSTLIAAMANHLKFDIYFFDISNVTSDSMLRQILLTISNRSMIVIEDIDCAQLAKRGEEKKDPGKYYKYTLSGFLNAMDGLWSSCGEEQIIVFTTNHKDLLDRHDPALFRPGRIDMHVPMSYCTMDAFKMLASTYLDFKEDHRLYGQIEGLFANAEVTPAEIAEEFSRTEDTDAALKAIVEVLNLKQKTEVENAIDV
ncbi:AAA-ATPase At3g50940-like [Castanea sativa]|uniref:AAA-ATPase At3g50940-like n=1 Tax=Castanea sativa TaxID=21020 RepID=UPI003F64AC8B